MTAMGQGAGAAETVDDELVDALIGCGAVRFGDFTLASGAKSDYYVDIKKATTLPDVLRLIADRMRTEAAGYDAVAGMELGAVPLAVATSLAAEVPYLIVRKGTKGYGTGKRIEGDLPPGSRVLVLEDVTTSGGSSVEAVQVLREAGYMVDRVVTVVDRESGAAEAFAAADCALVPLVRASQLLTQRKD